MNDKLKDVKYYQNNPCLVVRDINDEFCEVQLNVHFAANIESEYYCTPPECLAPMSSNNEDEYENFRPIQQGPSR